jgi:riboflavin biosynthesis pyrimidine reductase
MRCLFHSPGPDTSTGPGYGPGYGYGYGYGSGDDGDGAVDLAAAYAYPATGPWLRANMVASADGAATAEGRSEGLSGPADKRVFSLLRALADVIVVGARTVRREGYGAARPKPGFVEARLAAGRPPAAVVAVVSRSLDLDFSGPLFSPAQPDPAGAGPGPRTIVITSAAASEDALRAAREVADVVVAGGERVDLAAALDALAERGHTRLLTEGGPHLLAQLLAAGRLDELCLTISPLLTGDDTALRILTGTPLEPPVPLRLGHLLEDDGMLFARYLTGNG